MTRLHSFYMLILLALPGAALAQSEGRQAFEAIKQCVMQNDREYCHSVLTPDSFPLFDRFYSYRLMPCLPTDFTYESEHRIGDALQVKATLPAENNKVRRLRMMFHSGKLDILESLRVGLGEKWEERVNMAEQLFLFLRANSGGEFKCDDVQALAPKR